MKKIILITALIIYAINVFSQADIKGSEEPEMIFVEGGTYQMGNNNGIYDEKPAHTVTLNSFYICRYEITQKQWESMMGDKPACFQDCPTCPVEKVSWEDTQEFIKRLNLKTGKKYRLPTEAEWEFAARGGNNSNGFKFPGNDDPEDVAWFSSNSGGRTHPVGQKLPNELGIYDMSGNVWELCNDAYNRDYYKNSPKDNPRGPKYDVFRVMRGGSFRDIKGSIQYFNRSLCSSNTLGCDYGFRLAIDY